MGVGEVETEQTGPVAAVRTGSKCKEYGSEDRGGPKNRGRHQHVQVKRQEPREPEPEDKNMEEASSRVTENPEIKCDKSTANADTDAPAPGESFESPSLTPAYNKSVYNKSGER